MQTLGLGCGNRRLELIQRIQPAFLVGLIHDRLGGFQQPVERLVLGCRAGFQQARGTRPSLGSVAFGAMRSIIAVGRIPGDPVGWLGPGFGTGFGTGFGGGLWGGLGGSLGGGFGGKVAVEELFQRRVLLGREGVPLWCRGLGGWPIGCFGFG